MSVHERPCNKMLILKTYLLFFIRGILADEKTAMNTDELCIDKYGKQRAPPTSTGKTKKGTVRAEEVVKLSAYNSIQYRCYAGKVPLDLFSVSLRCGTHMTASVTEVKGRKIGSVTSLLCQTSRRCCKTIHWSDHWRLSCRSIHRTQSKSKLINFFRV